MCLGSRRERANPRGCLIRQKLLSFKTTVLDLNMETKFIKKRKLGLLGEDRKPVRLARICKRNRAGHTGSYFNKINLRLNYF